MYRIIKLWVVVFSLASYGCTETVEGDWTGILDAQGTKLSINFHITKSEDKYNSSMDVPTQGANDIQTTSTTFENNELTITVENMQMEYKGTFNNGTISGTYTQRGNTFPLDFTRIPKNDTDNTRPQDPKEPYPYTSEDIKFVNGTANNIVLAGTLTLPKNIEKPPVVILISGDGGQDRDATLFGHRPFLVLSDFLTRNGIAVVRVDDRGIKESEGTQRGITLEDVASDVEAALSFLQSRTDLNRNKIGLLGHSDGGFVAQIVASRNDVIDFAILLGSPGVTFEGSKVHPKEYLSKIKCRVLALNGDKDMIRDSKIHLPAIEASLREAENADVTAIELKNINHFFQTTTEHGGIRAVSSIEETYSPNVLDIIKNWILPKVSVISTSGIIGNWEGILEAQGASLPFHLHISKTDKGYSATMDSPNQGAMGISTTSTTFQDNELIITSERMQMVYKGILDNDKISGIFTQRENIIPLNFKRSIPTEVDEKNRRPQDPTKPYPYHSEEVSFTNPKASNIKLAGTLTLPENVKSPPAAILITGTGAQNRNEEIFNHRPFLVLSDYLTRNGIAVLRYDDRGVGESEGALRGTNSADLATDVEAAINFLKARTDIDRDKIGLIGHSEGGLIAPIVASRNKHIAFIVSLAGTGTDGLTLLLSQERRQAELRGIHSDEIDFNQRILKRVFTIVKKENDPSKIAGLVREDLEIFRKQHVESPYIETLTDTEIESIARTAHNPKNVYFFKTDPKQFWAKVQCPVLAINGDKDSQVDSKYHLPAIKRALKEADNNNVVVEELEGLNHLFQTAKTGSKEEYEQIEETFSPKALLIIKDWIITNTK